MEQPFFLPLLTAIPLILRIGTIDYAVANVIVVDAAIISTVDLIVLAARAVGLVLVIHAVQMPIADVLVGQAAILIAEETLAFWIRRRGHDLTHLIQTHAVIGAREILEEFAIQIFRQTQTEDIEEEATAAHGLGAECLAGRHSGAAEDQMSLNSLRYPYTCHYSPILSALRHKERAEKERHQFVATHIDQRFIRVQVLRMR